MLVFVVILGLAFGSFLTALTYRNPRGITILKGRSICPNCKHKLSWYDNIPLASYIVLRARCRYCHRKISPRYPLLELSTAGLFGLVYWLTNEGCRQSSLYICTFSKLGVLALPYLLFLILLVMAVFVIDLEHTIIPDEIVFLGFIVSFILFLTYDQEIYIRLISSFGSAFFLLALNLITKGKGMGLGDVKFALLGGLVLKPPESIIWLFLSFFIGAIAGLVLMMFGKTKFGSKIAFGPFLSIAFIIVLIFGKMIYPYAFFW